MSVDSVQSSSSQKEQAIFYSSRAAAITSQGIFTSFDPKGVLQQGQTPETSFHEDFAKGIRIYDITGFGEGHYLVWQLAEPTKESAVKKLFLPFLNKPQQEWFLQNIKNLIKSGANDVFVEAMNASPYEKYMSTICSQSEHRRKPALLIAFYGRRNANPCDCCLERMGRNFNSGEEDGDVPVMVPFFECRSINGFHNGACANCVYHVEAAKCTFANAETKNIKAVRNSMARAWVEFEGMPQAICIGKTSQIGNPYSFDLIRNQEYRTVRGRRPRAIRAEFPERQPWE